MSTLRRYGVDHEMSQIVGAPGMLGDREIGVIAASSDLARDGHVLVVSGLRTENFRRNPIILADHSPDNPIGAAIALAVVNDKLGMRIQFAPAGASTTADEWCALAKAGVVNGVSIGFSIINAEPLDPSLGSRGGLRITDAELLECSLVAVPADTSASVVARSFSFRPGAEAMLRALPAISAVAIERALAETAARVRALARPQIMLSAREQFEADRQKAMTVWALQQGEREREKARACDPSGGSRKVDSDYAERQADLRRLSGERTH